MVLLVALATGTVSRARADETLADLVARHADDEALALLDTLPASGPHRYLRGRLLERAGDLTRAAEAFASVEGLPDSIARDARITTGRRPASASPTRSRSSRLTSVSRKSPRS